MTAKGEKRAMQGYLPRTRCSTSRSSVLARSGLGWQSGWLTASHCRSFSPGIVGIISRLAVLSGVINNRPVVVRLRIIDEEIPPLEEEAIVLVDVVRAAGPWAKRSMGKARACERLLL